MKNCIIVILLNFIFQYSNAQNKIFDSLYAQSDLVFVGSITHISGAFVDDVGTENYYVTIQTDTIYKQHFFVNQPSLQVHWVITNTQCKDELLSSCITKYKNKKNLFFLTSQQVHGIDGIPDSVIFDFDSSIKTSIDSICEQQKIHINYFNQNKICKNDCELCTNIKLQNWKKVKKYIAHHIHKKNEIGWMQHQRIKWILPDRAILASLPSYMGIRFLFVTDTADIEAYIGFQVGYIKTWASWAPYLAYRWWGVQWYKYFSIENVDTLILKSFVVNTNFSKTYLQFEKEYQYTRMTSDTALQKYYGMNMILPDNYILMASAFDGEIKFYEDYKTMPDYIQRGYKYIDELLLNKKLYLLCFMAAHTHPEIGKYALQALQKLNDNRCIPFLIELAKYCNHVGLSEEKYILEEEKFEYQLLSTMQTLTGCINEPQSVPMGVSGNNFDISLLIPLWEKKIRIEKYFNR
jgi:hypothetical protein